MATMIFLLALLAATAAVSRYAKPAMAPRPARRRDMQPRTPRTEPPPAFPALDRAIGAADRHALPSEERARIRDRYITVRFAGAIRGTRDLQSPRTVIDAARHYFEEGKFERSRELLELAIEGSAHEESLRLAAIEIAFLTRDGDWLLELARGLREALPECSHWHEVQQLGRALLPAQALFGASPGLPSHEHYGPWPDTPNWIGASWDLTAEIRAADFHHAMMRTAARDCIAVHADA